jgi:DNA primase
LQVLRRYTDSITLVLDGDDAGRRRTNEILDALLALFEKNQVDLRILTLPQGIDPCDFIATHGSDPFRALLATAVDALEHKFRTVTNGLDTLTDTHRASQAAEQLLATLAQLRPAAADATSTTLLREEQMLSRIARRFHLPEESLRTRLVALRREASGRQRNRVADQPATASQNRTSSQPVRLADLPTWDRELLELLLAEPSIVTRVDEMIEAEALTSPVARRIYITCCRLAHEGQGDDFGRLLAEFDDSQIKNLLVQLDESCSTKTKADRERWLADLLETNRRRREEGERRTDLAAARENSGDEAEQLMTQFFKQTRPKHLSEYERRKK